MKSFLVLIALLIGVTLSSSPSITNAANSAVKERGVMQFNNPVKLMGVTLPRGEYLFVHDDYAMARGQACTYVYKGLADIPENLVVSFHCSPAERTLARTFTVRTIMTATGEYEVTEFQYRGSTEAHVVPTPNALAASLGGLAN